MFLLYSAVVFTIFLVIAFFNYLKFRTRLFQRLGIDGPPAHWLYGHLQQLHHDQKTSFHTLIQSWTKQYGKVYGLYEGAWPLLVISDLDMLEEIFIKQFRKFSARNPRPLIPDSDKDKRIHMFFAYGSRWKRLRSICNPAFTASKMKQMSGTMNDSVDTLMEILDGRFEEGKAFDIYRVFGAFTLDTIARCGFALKSDCQRNQDDELLLLNRKIFSTKRATSLLITSIFLFPPLNHLVRAVLRWNEYAAKLLNSPFVTLREKIVKVVEYRRQHKTVFEEGQTDLIQLMLEAEMPAEEVVTDYFAADKSNGGAGGGVVDFGEQKIERKLIPQEIVAQSILFLLAGYETTSTTLAYCSYLLATNPKVQEKLQEEIDRYFSDGNQGLPSYENVSKLPYLDMVLCETLRLYPLASVAVGRKALEDSVIRGVKIPGGMPILVDVWSVHRDVDVWGEDADQFRPERFSPEFRSNLHPMAWLPFGAGPRTCIGMRFALMEAKIALCRILKRYTLQQCAETEVPLNAVQIQTVIPINGVYVKLIKRDK